MNTCNVLTEINSQQKAFLVYFKYHENYMATTETTIKFS